MIHISELILQTIRQETIDVALELLEKNNLLENSKICPICSKSIGDVGGFLPDKEHNKIIPICDSLSCILNATYLIMKNNGNGSAIIER